MRAGRDVEDYLEHDSALRGISTNAFYQHEYHHINADFPYPDLTLSQLGIPQEDIVHIVADGIDHYLELSNR